MRLNKNHGWSNSKRPAVEQHAARPARMVRVPGPMQLQRKRATART